MLTIVTMKHRCPANRFNRRHRRKGHLFQGRFKAHLVEADNYAMELLR
jgi:hypothetical protein